MNFHNIPKNRQILFLNSGHYHKNTFNISYIIIKVPINQDCNSITSPNGDAIFIKINMFIMESPLMERATNFK